MLILIGIAFSFHVHVHTSEFLKFQVVETIRLPLAPERLTTTLYYINSVVTADKHSCMTFHHYRGDRLEIIILQIFAIL